MRPELYLKVLQMPKLDSVSAAVELLGSRPWQGISTAPRSILVWRQTD